jgi:hypothetical protein
MSGETFIYDDECEMPRAIQQLHHELHVQARYFYGLRNRAKHDDTAAAMQRRGDVLLADALALTGEWSA